MNKSVLIELLSRFTPKEIKEFDEFIKSPFFNKNQSVINLFEYLRKQYPAFDKECIEKKTVYANIFPGVDYNDGFMRTLMFNLGSLAEDYISYTYYKNNYYTEKSFLLHELNNRELNRLFERNYKAVSKQLNDEQIKDADYYFNKYNIEFENLYYLHRINPDKIEKIVVQSDVEEVFDNLTNYYLIQSMDHYIYFLNIMELYRFRFNTDELEKIVKILKTEKYKDIPTIEIYYNVLMLFLKEEDTSYFHKILELLKKNENVLHKSQLHHTYLNLKNYCRRRIQKEDNRFIKELFKIYQIELNKKIYPMQNEMSFRYYTGVIETALKLKEYKWTKDFIEKYKCELGEDSRENAYLYGLALYEFAMKNYEQSLEPLSKVRYNDVYHKLKYRSLLVMLFYELDYTELLLSHIDSFNHFLLNDKLITAERKEHYSNFLKSIKAIIVYKGCGKGQDIDFLRKKIIENHIIYNKEWLIEKLDELKD
jgi:hypothetical protein